MAVLIDGIEAPEIQFSFTGEWEHRAPKLKDGEVETVYWRTGEAINAAQVENARIIRCPLCGEEFADWGLSAERSHLRNAHGFQYVEGPSGCLPSRIVNQIPRPYWGLFDANGVLHVIRSTHHAPAPIEA